MPNEGSTVAKREVPATGILQGWVAKLGLRHQGVLLTVIRGCDTSPKEDASKAFTRALRGVLLNTHCANPEDAKSFIETLPWDAIDDRSNEFLKSVDQYPHHFVMHVIHACEVIGFHHPDCQLRDTFRGIYFRCCKKLHVIPENERQLDNRLSADEHSFAAEQ